jgi:hypothetical protein
MTTRRHASHGAWPLLALSSGPDLASTNTALRNAGDPAFALVYHDDVVMESMTPLTSAKAIVGLTKDRCRSRLSDHHLAMRRKQARCSGNAASLRMAGRTEDSRSSDSPPFNVQDWS